LKSNLQSAICNLQSAIPKITDFGLAKKLDEAGQTASGAVMGTPSYMAPEQAAGRVTEVGPAADVYALGAILYEALTGRPPFRGQGVLETLEQVCCQEPVPPRFLQPKVPRDLETICLRCLEKEPRRRYAGALDLAEDLGRFLAGEPIRARPVGSAERAWKWARRRPAVSGLLAAVVAVAALGFGLVTWKWRDAAAARDQAQTAEREADTARDVEKAQRERAEGLSRDLAAELYHRSVSLADEAVAADDVLRADEVLDSLPPGARRWEWDYLKRRCHADRLTFQVDGGTLAGAVSADGKRLATGGGDPLRSNDPGALQVWDLETGQRLFTTEKKHSGPIAQVVFHPDGEHVASVSMGIDVAAVSRGDRKALRAAKGEVILWEAKTGKPVRTFAGGGSVCFSPDGKLLAVPGPYETVKVYAVDTAAEVVTLPGHRGKVGGVCFSPDGKLLAAGSWEMVVAAGQSPKVRHGFKLWNTATWKEATLAGSLAGSDVSLSRFSPDGKLLASRDDRQVKVWDVATGALARTLTGHRLPVSDVDFSPDGRLLASCDNDGRVRLWDVEARTFLRELGRHTLPVRAVAFSPDGRLVASASLDKTVKLWSVADGKEVGKLEGHLNWVRNLAFSPDGGLLATASFDRTVKLWDVSTGHEVHTFRGHTHFVQGVTFSPDGESLASSSYDQTVRIWRLPSRK